MNGDGVVNQADDDIITAHDGTRATAISLLADLNGDFAVNDADVELLGDNMGMTGATRADGDLDGNGTVTIDDLDEMFAQYGLKLAIVS